MARLSTRPLASTAGTEARLHAASVRAGAGAAINAALHSVPLLRPFIPKRLMDAAEGLQPETVRRELVQTIYQRYGLKPARWELESVLAVAETQAKLSPLTRKDGLRDLLREWLPAPLIRPLLAYTPVEPLVADTVRAVATTWAAGRYADAVCRVRQSGMDWLPAPLSDALDIAPSMLREFSAEALTMALPPLKLAAAWGGQMIRASGRIAKAAKRAASEKKTSEKTPKKRVALASKAPASAKAKRITRSQTPRGSR